MEKIQTSMNLWMKITTFGFKAAAAIVTNVIEHLVSPYTLALLLNDVIPDFPMMRHSRLSDVPTKKNF